MEKKKLKVMFAIDCMNIGGAPSVVYEQIVDIDKTKFDVVLATLYRSKKNNFLNQLEDRSVRVVELNLKKHKLIYRFRTWLDVYRLIKKEKVDIIYSHLFLSNLIFRSMAVLNKVPKVYSFEHSMYFDKKRWQILADKLLSFFTSKILVSTDVVASFTAKQENIGFEKFFIMPNPITLPKNNKKIVDDLKYKYKIPDNKKIILNLGRLSEEKGQIVLLEAIKELSKERADFYSLIVGHGREEKKLREYINRNNLNKICQVIVEPQMAKYFYQVADIFILPSFREGQSMVTYEALMSGLPVISSDLPTIKEVVREGENGMFFETGNSNALKACMSRCLDDHRLLEKTKKGNDPLFETYLSKSSIKRLEEIFVCNFRKN